MPRRAANIAETDRPTLGDGRPSRRRRSLPMAALTLLLSLLVVGCATGTTSEDGRTTLLVWDEPTGDPALDAAIGRVYDAFAASHPAIAIERAGWDLEAEEDGEEEVLRRRLASGTGPDVVSSGGGAGFVGPIASRRYLVALNELPVRYRWSERLYEPARHWVRTDDRLFALPLQVEALGFFVDRTLLDGAGLDLPRTAEDLLAFCRTARAGGLVPIAVGVDPAARADLFAMALNNLYGPRLTGSLLFEEWPRWDTTRVARALRLVAVEMDEAGCFPAAAEAPDEAAALALFADGRAPLLPASTGSAGAIGAATTGRELGLVPFPAMPVGQGRALPARVGLVFAIAAKSAHPREAAMLLDFLLSDVAARIWVEEAGIVPPVRVDADGWTVPPGVGTALEAINAAGARRPGSILGPALGYALDPGFPEGFRAALDDGFRALLAGETTPERLADDLERAWNAAVAAEEGDTPLTQGR